MTMLRTTLLSAAAALFAVVGATSAFAGETTCTLRVVDRGSSIEIEPIVHAATAIDGQFTLAITGGGTVIDQSGGFSAMAGTETSLGAMNLSLGNAYNAKLNISWPGGSARCVQTL
jgi:hypothetical protein